MGYRSEVTIAIDKTQRIKMDLLGKSLPSLLLEADEILPEDACTYYIFHSIKWYEAYAECAAVHAYFTEIEKMNKDVPCEDGRGYGFIRIGEEHIDIETLGDPWEFGMDINRHVVIN